MPDHGPIYIETLLALDHDVLPVIMEPWNAASAILFIVLALFWMWKIRIRPKRDIFLPFAVTLLLVGGVGGTLYHGLRTERMYLLMDWMPIAILSVTFVLWIVEQLTHRRVLVFLVPVLGFLSILILHYTFVRLRLTSLGPSVGYVLLALYILVPLFLLLRKQNYVGAKYVYGATGAFLIAYVCRSIDRMALLPMGTHFLWHVFGAVATHLLLSYVWTTEMAQAQGSLVKEKCVSGGKCMSDG